MINWLKKKLTAHERKELRAQSMEWINYREAALEMDWRRRWKWTGGCAGKRWSANTGR